MSTRNYMSNFTRKMKNPPHCVLRVEFYKQNLHIGFYFFRVVEFYAYILLVKFYA